jgi:hypothetical protein
MYVFHIHRENCNLINMHKSMIKGTFFFFFNAIFIGLSGVNYDIITTDENVLIILRKF